MDECFVLEKENPREKASIFSKLCFLWTEECASKSSKKDFRLEDIYKCLESFRSNRNGNHLEEKWKQELKACWKHNTNPSLLRAIVKAYYLEYLPLAVTAFLNYVVIKGLQPLVLSNLIRLFIEKKYTTIEMTMYGGGICLIILCSSFLLHHTVCGSNLLAIKIRLAVSSLVYRKVLMLNQQSLSASSPGHVVNLLSNDVGRFDHAIQAFHFLWMTPIQLTVIILVVWNLFGSIALIGIITLVAFLVPLQAFLGHLTGVYRKKAAEKTDMRVKLMNEILTGMEVIKMYTWEKPFETLIHKTREEELRYIKRTSYIRGILACMMFVTEKLGLCVTIVSFSLLGFPVYTNVVFSLSVCFRVLQYSLGTMLPAAITIGSEVLVSVKRLQQFLILEEKCRITSEFATQNEHGRIDLRGVSAHWTEKQVALNDISISIPSGCLCAIVGPVGSSKSSLLKAILGEIPCTKGLIAIRGNISFSSQKPWLFNSSVRKNIIFDQEFDETRYRRVLEACGLNKDLEQFQSADQTVVGTRGVSLSGGQRARISLARAVYRKADIYLLDDILSALDAKIGKYVFDECIRKFLKGKTRVLVTHQPHYLRVVQHIVILNKGGIEEQGTFSEISGNKPQKYLEELEEKENIRKSPDIEKNGEYVMKDADTEEEKKLSQIDEITYFKGSVIRKYVKFSGSIVNVVLLFLFLFISQISLNLSDFWVTVWSEQEYLRQSNMLNPTQQVSKRIKNDKPNANIRNGFKFSYSTNDTILSQWTDTVLVDLNEYTLIKTSVMRTIYIAIISVSIGFMLLRSTLFYHLCMKASQQLHNKMFSSLLEAPMVFFHTTPPGNTLNRFSKDIGIADESFPKTLINVLGSIPVLFGSMFLIVISNSFMLILIIPLWLILLKMRKWFLATVKTLRRIETSMKSPIFSYVTSTIDGLTTIRSSNSEELLVPQFDRHQDIHTASSYLAISCTSAFGLWLDLLCVLFVSCVILSFIVLDQYIYISGSFISLAIFHSMTMVGLFQFCIRTLSETVNHLTNIKRILDYTELEKEEDKNPNDDTVPRSWPTQGDIEFIDLNFKYSDKAKLVLENLNLKICAAEKIGIVGRTGAGKTSIISALFRLSSIEGKILIDGVNIQNVELKKLRREIAIIPQEPFLFSASVRFNLDPFFEFPDERIWNVLKEVKLTNKIPSLDLKLSEGGNNFSVGERQLMCLARAILKDSKILILDEATANVDMKTDEFIQETIKKKFVNATVLTVAHRLNFVMGADKVIVMDAGKVVQFGHPLVLLQDESGYFRHLVEESDLEITDLLKKS